MTSAPFANVFSAFSEGLEKGPDSFVMPPASAQASRVDGSELDTSNLLQLLQTLESEGGQLQFSAFAKRLPGDPVTTLTSTVKLMKEGWVEFVGDANENSDVRLTALGRDMLATLRGSTSAA